MEENKPKNNFKIYLINEKDSITIKINEEYNNQNYAYICNFSIEDITKIHKIFYLYNDNIEKLFNYLKKILEKKKLVIKKEIINISLLINYIMDDIEINIEFFLSKISSNFLNNINPIIIENNNIDIINNNKINQINYVPKENQNNILNNTNEIERYQKLFENKMNQHIYFNSDPTKLTLNTTITNNCSTCRWTTNNSFCIFKSILNDYLVVYGNNSKNYSIEFYDITSKKLNGDLTINNAHKDKIVNIKHYYYQLKNQDLILSSSQDGTIKLWQLYSLKNLLILYHPTQTKDDFRLCCEMTFFNRIINDFYIITRRYNEIKIWNNKGENINTYKGCSGTIYLNKYYYNFKNYLLYGGTSESKIELRDIENGEIIHKYDDNCSHWVEIYEIDNEKRVIAANYNNCIIKIFDFDTENLIKSLTIEKEGHIFSFCLWNEKYILVGCLYSIKLLNIDEGKLIKEFNGIFTGWGVLSIFKFNHQILGDCIAANDSSGDPDRQGKINLLSI